MSNAVFHEALLTNYQVLDRPGTFIVTVAYDVTHANYITKDEYPRYIVPLRVITGENLGKLIEVLNDNTQLPFGMVSKYFMSGALFDPDDSYNTSNLPTKGERIVATFDMKDDKLMCTHLKPIDREELFYVDLSKASAFFAHVNKFTKA